MVHDKKTDCNISYVQASWVVCLVAWSSNNQNSCLCWWFPSLAFFLTHQILNPIPLYGFWLWLVHESIIPLPKTGVPSSARWLCMFAPFDISDYGNHFLMAAISLHHWVDVTLSHSKAQCLLASFRQTAQVNFLLLTLSATQLHVGKTLWLAVNNLCRRNWANKTFVMFRYCCLTAIKHCTTRSVLFPNIVWLQREFYAVQRKIYLLHAVCLQRPLQLCCCSCLQHDSKNPKL